MVPFPYWKILLDKLINRAFQIDKLPLSSWKIDLEQA